MMDAYGELEQSMISMSGNDNAQNQDELVKLGAFKQTVDSLNKQYSGTEYAQYANLQLAKYYALDGNLSEAEAALRKVLDSGPNKNIKLITTLRLTRVIVAQERYDDALKLIDTTEAGSYESAFLELKGDVFYQKGDEGKALEAYSAARDASTEESFDLNMKYYNLLGR